MSHEKLARFFQHEIKFDDRGEELRFRLRPFCNAGKIYNTLES